MNEFVVYPEERNRTTVWGGFITCGFIFVFFLLVLAFAIMSFGIEWILPLIFVALLGVVMAFVAYFHYKSCTRTLIFTEDGCTATFLGRSEFWSWSQISVKRLDVSEDVYGRTEYLGLCLSTNPKDADSKKGFKYNSIFPRTKGFCVYLGFAENNMITDYMKDLMRHPRYYYIVERQELVDAFHEFGIEI